MIDGLDPAKIQRILVCQQRQLGDVVLATPCITLLAKKFPHVAIDFFTEKKCVPLLEHNPHIHHIWTLDKEECSTIKKTLAFYWEVARTPYDIIIALQNLPRIHWICALSSAKYKLSNTPAWYNRLFFTQVIPQQGTYAAEHKASVLRLLDIHWNKEPPKIYLTEEEKNHARQTLFELGVKKGHVLITLDPTHRRETRRYPLDHYATIVDVIANKYPTVRILPLYGPGEEDVILSLLTKVQHKEALILPSAMLSLRELASILHYTTLHIGNCSAPRHIAVAVGTATFTILGSTDASWTYPSPKHKHISAELSCQPCYSNICPKEKDKNACLESLPPSWVATLIMDHLTKLLRK